MTVLISTLNQMAFLLLLIIIGFILCRFSIVEQQGAGFLSKMENNVFVPALVLGTFMNNFTLEKIRVSWKYFLCGLVVISISCVLAVFLSKLFTKDTYLRNIYTYGLAFANFGFMGNAVVLALFPDIFMEYLIFVMPFWVFIYIWAVPSLLMPSKDGKKGILGNLKNLANPMLISMLIGMLMGLFNFPIPDFLDTGITTLGNCMSPIAMLLTGMTIAKIDLKATFKNLSIYLASFVRLIAIPLAAILILLLLPLPYGVEVCVVCSLAMPLGLNTIVVPGAYGKDTSVAAGMALISHLLSCITIPIIFMIFDLLVK